MSDIHFEIYGSGQPLVMLHGWAMHSGLWRGFAKRLAEHYLVICIDLPGHGGSKTILPFTLQQITKRLLVIVPDQPCYWLGWSLGGSVAMYIAGHYPERVTGLIVMAGNPSFIGDKNWPGMPKRQLENFAAELQQNFAKTLMRFMGEALNNGINGRAILKRLKKNITECHVPEDQILQGGLKILEAADFRETLDKLTCPVLFVLGENDSLVPVSVVKPLGQLLPAAEIHIIEQAGHAPFLSHEQKVISIISNFMEKMNTVFELDKTEVKRSFSAASITYDGLSNLQKKSGDKLLELYANSDVSGQVLDLGCGTGFLSDRLIANYAIQNLTAVDIVFAMLQIARRNLAVDKPLQFVCADAESLPLQASCKDWIFSNLALQWCRNLNAVFSGTRHCLKPEGHLVFSTFGPQTLKELKQVWSLVDDHTHVNQFYSEDQLIAFLQQEGLTNIRIESHCYVSKYDTVLDLMGELKGVGAHNVTGGRNRAVTGKGKFKQMLAAYEQLRIDGSIPATFEIIYVAAQAKG